VTIETAVAQALMVGAIILVAPMTVIAGREEIRRRRRARWLAQFGAASARSVTGLMAIGVSAQEAAKSLTAFAAAFATLQQHTTTKENSTR
jgi:hypothetical protein